MGLSYFDKWTIGHLGGGVLSYSLLQNSKLPILVNFVFSNGIHYLIECNEKNVAPNGSVIQTYENHIGDIIVFLVGWILAFLFRTDRYVTTGNAPWLWVVFLICVALEIFRENYPYNRWIRGAYVDDVDE
jgi:hypothetical protein